MAAEILPLLDARRFLEIEVPRILKEKRVSSLAPVPCGCGVTQVALRPEPLGVVLVIAPSNYPLMLPGIQTPAGGGAGNAVMIKPAAGCTALDPGARGIWRKRVGAAPYFIQILPEDSLLPL